MKKKISLFLAALVAVGVLAGCTPKSEQKEAKQPVVANVATLKGPTGMGIVKMMSDEKNAKDKGYNFTIANSVDEIVPLLVGKKADIAAVPSNVASVIYNSKKSDIVVLAVNTLGVLYVVENGNTINSVNDLKGKTVYSSGKGASPEYAFNYILKGNGLNPDADVKVEYKAEHTEALADLVKNKGGIAVLPQPFVTVAMAKNNGLRIALDLNKEWDKVSKEKKENGTLITGVIVARKDFVEKNPEKVKDFMEKYKKSIEFTNEKVDEAAKLIGESKIVPEAIAKKAIPKSNIVFIDGAQMKEKLSGYLKVLFEANPKSIGGKLPGEDFYYIQKN